ncbi:MAG TPA: hypothetical protein VF263_11115 [Longimicrobiaceae bacterium]
MLVLPVQAVTGLSAEAEGRLGGELMFALGERAPKITWVSPEELQRAVSRSPGFAGDPRSLPADPLLHHRERRAVEPLAGELRRYSALTDARLVLVPQAAAFVPGAAGEGGRVRLAAAMIDARTGGVVWWGEAEGDPRPGADTPAVASAAAALAARMLSAQAP